MTNMDDSAHNTQNPNNLQNYADDLDSMHDARLQQINSHFLYNPNANSAGPTYAVIPYKKTFKNKLMGYLPFILIFLGVVVFIYKVATPIVLEEFDDNQRDIIIKPFDSEDDVSIIKNPNLNFSFDELRGATTSPEVTTKFENLPEYFFITIPKLKIDKARIKTNSTELNPKFALGHYRGSCLPGDACNAFIYGHSTFKSIKNNYEDGDYTAVFSRLNELKYGDEFIVTYNDKDYRYVVNTMKIESPQNVDPLASPFSKGANVSSATLFTCDPPGTTKNRLEIIGILVS